MSKSESLVLARAALAKKRQDIKNEQMGNLFPDTPTYSTDKLQPQSGVLDSVQDEGHSLYDVYEKTPTEDKTFMENQAYNTRSKKKKDETKVEVTTTPIIKATKSTAKTKPSFKT
jgi:hypothetical protein